MDFELTYRQFSECSILVEWPSEISENILKDVLVFKNHLENFNIKQIVQVKSSYSSLLVVYVDAIDKINNEISILKQQYFDRVIVNATDFKLWKIPVCYDREFGLDLVEISRVKKLSNAEIIKLHSDVIYTVYFIGFLPGFLYLGGLDKRLHFPRKKSPRHHIKKGAVAIGGHQTGVYPNSSPGGWNIIGNSPLDFFNRHDLTPCFAKAGDRVQFVPIDRSEYDAILNQINNGLYQMKSEVIHG